MLLLIKFTTPLQRMEGSGWPKGGGFRPVGTGVVFPFEVVTGTDENYFLRIKQPTRLVFEDDVVVLQWESPEKTIGVSVPVSLIDTLTLEKQ